MGCRVAVLAQVVVVCLVAATVAAAGLPVRAIASRGSSAPLSSIPTPGVTSSATSTQPAVATAVAAPAPAATPLAMPTPSPSPTPPPPASTSTALPTANPATTLPADLLTGPGIDATVTTYSDCTGTAPVPRDAVAIDTCATWDTYFLGHNPGLFAPLVSYAPGTELTYYDATGTAHPYLIEGYVDLERADEPMPPPGTAAQFQTCLDPSGTWIRVFYAVAA